MASSVPVVRTNVFLVHMYQTYHWLRFIMGVLAIAFPSVVVAGHLALTKGPDATRDSLSAYYNSPVVGFFFVGVVFTVGVCLFIYQGYSAEEDLALDAAGVCALGVALVPYDSHWPFFWTVGALTLTLHGLCAVVLFVLLWYVAQFRAADTLAKSWHNRDRTEWYRRRYRDCGWGMIGGVIAAVILHLTYPPFKDKLVLTAEWVGIWSFGAFWLLKSHELRIRANRDRELLERVELKTI